MTQRLEEDERWMQVALQEAEAAAQKGEVPVGAVVVHNGQLIAKSHNLRELNKDPLAHAELLAIAEAAEHLDRWRLIDCTLYVTLEPCPMCAGAIVNSRLDRIVFGASDPRAGSCGSIFNIAVGSASSRCRHAGGNCEGIIDSRVTYELFRRQGRKSLYG